MITFLATPFTKEFFNAPGYGILPHMSHVTLLFLIQDDQILLAMKKRGFGVGRYNGVGGKIETDESIEEALVRECQEEIGVTPFAAEKVARLTFRTQEAKEQGTICHVFIARDWEGEPVETEEMAPEWFYTDMIPFDKMWPDDAEWLPLVLNGQYLTGEFTFDADDNIISQQLTMAAPEHLHEA